MSQICNLCGSDNIKRVYDFKEHHLVQCLDCSLQFLSPLPDIKKLKSIYSENYYLSPDSNLFGYSNYKEDVNLIVMTSIRRYNNIRNVVDDANGIRLLDVGCAYGYYMDIARLYGWNVTGIEINQESAKEARETLKLDVTKGTICDQDFPDESFDIITCWDLIEHLMDPQTFFDKASKLLKPGGSLFVSTPDVESLPSKMMGKKWMGYKSLEHLYFFSKKTLSSYFENCGLQMHDHAYIGKYISKDMLFDRLKNYFGIFADIAGVVKPLLPTYFYINPFDILYARGYKAKK